MHRVRVGIDRDTRLRRRARSPEHGLQFPDGRLVVGFSAGEAEKLQGFHSPNLLAIVDEASGVEPAIFEALKGALTGSSARLLLVGNPTRVVGEFYAAFNSDASLYHQLHTSAFDSPNVTHEETAIEGVVDKAWIDEIAADYGEGSAAYAIRVLGNFPNQSSNAVIGLDLVETAQEGYAEAFKTFDRAGQLEIGVDVARYGEDETVIVARRGLVIREPRSFRGLDTVAVSARVLEMARALRRSNERVKIKVDSIGIGGGVVDQLRQNSDVEVIAVDASARSPTAAHARLRDSLWFSLRDWLKAGGVIPPNDSKMAGDLLAPTYEFDRAQKIVVSSKDEIKKLIKRSPDRAEATTLRDGVVHTFVLDTISRDARVVREGQLTRNGKAACRRRQDDFRRVHGRGCIVPMRRRARCAPDLFAI